jgi:phage shock protein A
MKVIDKIEDPNSLVKYQIEDKEIPIQQIDDVVKIDKSKKDVVENQFSLDSFS